MMQWIFSNTKNVMKIPNLGRRIGMMVPSPFPSSQQSSVVNKFTLHRKRNQSVHTRLEIFILDIANTSKYTTGYHVRLKHAKFIPQ